jgi:hypothetical protein
MALANGGNWSWHGLEKMTGGKHYENPQNNRTTLYKTFS